MPNYIMLSREAHATKRWKSPTDYLFAASEAIAPLAAFEVTKATLSFPLAFIPDAESFHLVAMLGLEPDKNLFVAPDGRWLAVHVPAAFRSHPFRLVNTPEGQQVLCVDADSGLMTDAPTGEPFFNDDGTPATGVNNVLEFLTRIEANRPASASACAALQACKLIVPWEIMVQSETGQQKIEGLFKVDEAALTGLSDEDFARLRKSGALLLAYCQMLSMQNLGVLGQLAQAKMNAAQAVAQLVTPSGDLDLEFLNLGGTISYGNLM